MAVHWVIIMQVCVAYLNTVQHGGTGGTAEPTARNRRLQLLCTVQDTLAAGE